ncbi:hypothetical protein [Variovorax soli]|uniref:Lipoprotein n=1 Tax=Variovorax soli TaxID=376815 RepID=A0ABU1NK98_9BURK|nr:hypothetical protein [Variovorax soli]MDR6538872.1 hypothetical protein [Variovorax soli]
MRGLLWLALLPIAGCVTPGQQAKRPTANDDPSKPCFESIAYDKRFVGLREKIAINLKAERPSMEMLTDRTVPTEEEKRLLGVWMVAREACFDMGASFRAKYASPEYQATLLAGQTRVKVLTAKLYAGQISYGEFNQLRADNSVEGQQRLSNINQREREAAAAANAQEQARRDAAVGAALQNMQTQQLIQQQQLQQNGPRTTNCQRFGNQVNCTTY